MCDGARPQMSNALTHPSGPAHPRWKGGKYTRPDGYVEITAGPDRGKYEHRAVVEKLLGGPLPEGYEVGHNDFRRGHNCPSNLILMQECFNHPPNWKPSPRSGGRHWRKGVKRRKGEQ